MALFWISFAVCFISLAFFIYNFIIFKRSRNLKTLTQEVLIRFIISIIVFTIASLTAGFGIKLWNKFDMQTPHLLYLIFGSFIFGLSFIILFECFVIYYYKPDLDLKQRKIIKRVMFASIPFVVVFFVMSLEAYAPYTSFPLISGICFTSNGIKFITCQSRVEGFTIAWYGIIILTGAIITYFICDHRFYQEFHKHGILDVFFVIVLLLGILGARIWYCFVLDRNADFWNFQSGGLAIMGGVLFGSVFGIIYLVLFRRYINLRHAIDMILPAVLVAQAIGRWGNFFNHEVYGSLTLDIEQTWFIPNFIKYQMATTFGGKTMYLPLFLIECITNLCGYFVINYAVGKGLKKHTSFGDLFCLYIVWYGLTRVILEPMRAEGFEYGASYISAWVMFGGGLASIVGLHLYDYIRWGKYTFNINKMMNVDNPKHKNPKNPYFKQIEAMKSLSSNNNVS